MILPPALLGTVHLPAMGAVGVLCAAVAALGLSRARARDEAIPLSPWLFAAALLSVTSLLQLLPLPEGLLGLLSPEAADARRALREVGLTGVDASGPVSLSPERTALAAYRWGTLAVASAGLGALLSAQRRHRPALAALVAAPLGVLGVLEVAVGLTQSALGPPGTLLGFFQTTRSTTGLVNGTFVNANHAAALLAMATLASVGMAAARQGTRRWLWVAAAVINATGVILGASRGGLMALALAGGGLLLHLGARAVWTGSSQRGPSQAARLMPWLALVAMPVGLALALMTVGSWGDRVLWELGSSGDLTQLSQETKVQVIGTAAWMIGAFPLAGIGADAFGAVAPAWLGEVAAARFSFVESDPIEVLLAFGAPVGLTAMALAALAWWRVTAPSHPHQGAEGSETTLTPEALALAYALAALTISAAVSFNVEVLGLALPALVIGEALLAVRRRSGLVSVSRRGALGVLGALAAVAAVGLVAHLSLADVQRTPARVLELASAGEPIDDDALARALGMTPLDGSAMARAALARSLEADPERDALTLALAGRARDLAPSDPAAHLAFARVAARRGRPLEAAAAYRSAMAALRPVPPSLAVELLAALPTPELQASAIVPRPDAVRVVATQLIAQGETTAAMALTDALRKLHPELPEAHTWSARAALAAGQPLLAELYARHMIDAFPQERTGPLLAAQALAAQGRADQGAALLGEAIARLPDDPQLRLERAELLLGLEPSQGPVGRDALIREDLEHLRVSSISNTTTRAHFFYLSGLRWEQLGRPERAAIDFDRASKLRPEVKGYQRPAGKAVDGQAPGKAPAKTQ